MKVIFLDIDGVLNSEDFVLRKVKEFGVIKPKVTKVYKMVSEESN